MNGAKRNPRSAITLVGDGIENPANAQTMMDAAGMFAGECLFRNTAAVGESPYAPPFLVR